jgi:hypothetical protein
MAIKSVNGTFACIRCSTTAMLIASSLHMTNLEADSPNYYTVTRVNPTTQQIDGDVAGDPNGATFDGLLFSRATVDFETLQLQRDVSWYTPAGGFNKKYEHIRVEGNDKNVDSLTVYSKTPLDTDCFFYDLKVRSLALDNASFVLSDQESGAPNVPGCERPIDFYVSSNSNAVATEVMMENGILDLNARQLLVEGVPLTVAAISGVNTIRSPASESLAANPLQVRIDPGATLQIVPEPGLTRLSTSPEIDVNNSYFNVFGDLADANLVWGLAARSDQNFVVSNGGNLRVGNGSTTFRFGLEFAAGEGIQVNNSTVEVTPFAALSSSLLLNDSSVGISAGGHLVAEFLKSEGDSQMVAAPTSVESKIGSLQVISGKFVISGGQTLIDNSDSFSRVLGTLQLGRSGDSELPRLHFPGAESRNPLTPYPELFFSNGSKLTGEAIVTMNADAHALFFENGSTLDPGYSLGTLRLDGQLFMEDGSVFAAELDLSSVGSGQISSDQVALGAPYGYLSLGLGNGTELALTLLNDTALQPGAKARLITYPSASDWNGATFLGWPNGAVFRSGANWWQIRYDDPLVPGLEDVVPTRTVTLTVVAPNLTVTPSVTNFGPQLENKPSAEQVITLGNSGLAPLDIASVASSNPDYAKSTDNCSGGTLAGGATCTVGFVFTPSVAGVDISDLLINGQILGALVGEGIPGVSNGVSLTPSFLNFGDVDINSVAGRQDIVLANAAGVELKPLTFSILGSAQFAQTNDCGDSLADASNCTLQISFTPTAEGLDGAVLRVFDNGVLIAEAALTGTGMTEPLVSLVPASLDFGSQSVGVSSAFQQFAVQNPGTADLLVSSINQSTPDYSIISDNCSGTAVASGGSCTVEVVFTPSVAGSDPAGISVLSNASSSPDTLDLAGTGLAPELSLDRSAILFTPQLEGVPSAPQMVVVTNTGNATLDIATVISSTAEFTTNGGNCAGQSIAAGASCSFDVILTGDAEHKATGVISIASNAPTSPDTVQVSGVVMIPEVKGIPALNRFGLALMAVLTLGIGFIVMRRSV